MNTKKNLNIVDDGETPQMAVWARDAKMKITAIELIASGLCIMLTLLVGPANSQS